ncbi:MAG: 1-phosphofructokinase family hexose kinase [Acidobacteriota bacterium]|nr:1-phosphofructokinase family hexose kinase [Acidobacteriota bacterium]
MPTWNLVIVTLTVNPAIDRTIQVDRLAFEDRAYILSSKDTPGGRGINSASVIHSFGGETIAILPAGGASGVRFEEFLKDCGFPVVVVRIRNKVRTNLTIMDAHGLTMKLNEPGPTLDKSEVSKLDKAVRARLEGVNWLMLCGSLPPGVPDDFYANLIAFAHKQKVKTLLDTDGEALRLGIQAGPTVVKPNQAEAERLLNTAMLTRNHFISAAEQISRLGAEAVILSLGSRGVVGAFEGELTEVIPPHVNVVSPIGAGDALAAAFLWAMQNKDDYRDALRWGVAAGTASAGLPGMRFASLSDARRVYPEVEVRKVD